MMFLGLAVARRPAKTTGGWDKSLDPDTEAIKNFDSMHKLKLNVVIGARGK